MLKRKRRLRHDLLPRPARGNGLHGDAVMKLPADDPRRRYILVVDGKPRDPAPWSTVQMIAKHCVDCGNVVEIKKRKDDDA